MIDTTQILNLTHENFEKSISKGLSIVDFWAEWCGPCHIQDPILKDVADEVGCNALIAKLNVDDNRRIAAKYGIRSIPTTLIFKNGIVIKQFVGVQPKQILITTINNLLKK